MPEHWVKIFDGKAVAIEDLSTVASVLLEKSEGRKVWFFEGEMGAGKTTFIKVICNSLGVKDNTSSPTFSIINEYKSDKGSIYHFDFYRIERETEAYDMGVEEFFDSGEYCFVEWPERIPSLYPLHYLKVKISEQTPTTRLIEYTLL